MGTCRQDGCYHSLLGEEETARINAMFNRPIGLEEVPDRLADVGLTVARALHETLSSDPLDRKAVVMGALLFGVLGLRDTGLPGHTIAGLVKVLSAKPGFIYKCETCGQTTTGQILSGVDKTEEPRHAVGCPNKHAH